LETGPVILFKVSGVTRARDTALLRLPRSSLAVSLPLEEPLGLALSLVQRARRVVLAHLTVLSNRGALALYAGDCVLPQAWAPLRSMTRAPAACEHAGNALS
jgi:hypothetical protein